MSDFDIQSVINRICKPTPAMLWLERAAKQIERWEAEEAANGEPCGNQSPVANGSGVGAPTHVAAKQESRA